MLIILLLTRLRLRHRQKQEAAFRARWEPIFLQSLIQMPEVLPPLPKRDWLLWAQLFNFHLESVRGQSQTRLIELAQRLQFCDRLLRHLQRGSLKKRLMAIYTLGNLHCEQAWQPLTEIVFEKNSLLALSALRALLQLSPLAAFPILEKALETHHWPFPRLAGIVQRSGKQALVLPLGQALNRQQGAVLLTLIRLVGIIQAYALLPQLHQLLQERPELEIKEACLAVMGQLHDFSGRELLKTYLHHPDWRLRQQALEALTYIAQEDDIPVLLKHMEEADTWMGFIAAQGISRIPGMTSEKLVQLQENCPHPKVRTLLQMALK